MKNQNLIKKVPDMLFSNVIGQEKIKTRLLKSVKEERISHAQLFAGPEGTGKLALALAYAQYVSCRNRGENDSCGTCSSCHKYNKLAHPDLHFVFPVFKTKSIQKPTSDDFIHQWREFVSKNPYFNINQWLRYINIENAQGLIYERESEQILRKLNLKSFESEFKIMIIWLPEKMHQACSNKLLKMIEEPPSKTLFLLISENEEQIIGTIRSRTQLIKVPRIEDIPLKDAILKHNGIESNMLEEMIHLANGSFIKAMDYLNTDENNQLYFTKFQELMRFAYSVETLGLVQWADDLAGIGRESQKGFLNYALRLTREYFVLNLKNEKLIYLNNDEKTWGRKFSPFINEKNITKISSEFDLAHKHISMNGNPRIIFLDIALKMAKLIKS